jgi:hypothetical protein
MEEARDLYRAQFLELREANKELNMKCKASVKTMNAQKDLYRTKQRDLSANKENLEVNESSRECDKRSTMQSKILQQIMKERDEGLLPDL